MKYEHGGNIYKVMREKSVDVNSIIDFSANINPLGLSSLGEQSIIENISGLLNYPDPDYFNLKTAISQYNKVQMENIFLGNGAIDGLFFLSSFLKSKKALIVAPSFVEYERSLKATETDVRYHFLEKRDNFQLNTVSLIENLKALKPELLIICNPNNPTGNLVEISNILMIAEFCVSSGIRLLIDEAFMDFTDDEEKNSIIPYINKFENLFVLRSLTKFFAIPGLRIGYVLSKNNDFRDYYKKYKEPWMINYLAEIYSIAAIGDENYISSTREYIFKERKLLLATLNMIKGIKAYKSFGNFIFFEYLGSKDIKKALYERNILIRDCSNYEGLSKGYFRIAVKDRKSNSELAKKLREICEE